MTHFSAIILSLITFISPMLQASASPSLRDKIGQMLLIGFEGKTIDVHSTIVKLIQENNIGGVILFDYNARTDNFDKNIESLMQVKQLNHDLKSFTQQGNHRFKRPLLPLLIAVDYEGGQVNRLNENYGFPKVPSAEEVGHKNIEATEKVAEQMAETLKEAGFNFNFAPVLDVNVNLANPIIGKRGRSFSSHADQVVVDAGIYARTFLKHNIQCSYKHFPGHGSSSFDSHLGFVDVSNTWHAEELEPYLLLLQTPKSCGAVMTAHVVNRALDPSGLPATLSHTMLTDLLRKQFHFEGVIITDDLQMRAIRDHYGLEQAIPMAINAGADMLIIANALPGKRVSPVWVIDLIEAKVNAGEISPQRINEAYQHIIHLKRGLSAH
jgi:beta-N-acetylhexosaminidase